MAKQKLVLLNNAKNILDYPKSKLSSFEVEEEGRKAILDTVELFSNKAKGNFAYELVQRQMGNDLKNYTFVDIQKYILPAAFNTNTKKILINMSVWGRKNVFNIPPQDLYSIIIYGYICAYYSVKPIKPAFENDICDFMSSIYIKLFAKRYGLMGSYAGEINKLRFLVTTFTMKSFFNASLSKAFKKAGNLSQITIKDFDIDLTDFDFSDAKDFLRCLSDSGVLHGLTTYEFASKKIRTFGVQSLSMFEDGMRFMATLGASTINGNDLFSPAIAKYHPQLFTKIIDTMKKDIT